MDSIETSQKWAIKHAQNKKHNSIILNLTGFSKVTDAGLGKLAEGCTMLQQLNLSICDQVSDAGLGRLAEGCRMLQ